MTTFKITMARPDDGEMELFWKLFRAAARVEDRWNSNTVPFLAEGLQNDDLSRAQKLFLFRAWQVLVDGHGGFGRLMGAFDTYVHNFQNASADYVDLKPSLQELWADGQILPVVLEAYEEAKQDGLVNWEAAASLNVENEELKRKVAALEQQLSSGFTPEALAQEERAEKAEQRIIELEHDALRLNSVISTEANRADRAEQQLAAERADKRRMDWLVSHYVEVRTPLVYGSHALFVAQVVSEDWAEEHATSLREQIDAAMKVEGE
ncbi:hypothetical protein ABRP57_00285 [Pectobacterium aroidearum]|uniref:hypothetical protein n=1 Tax=Pectobacterium aroidearum TaxID=1201031 RepID=UPI0032EB86CF